MSQVNVLEPTPAIHFTAQSGLQLTFSDIGLRLWSADGVLLARLDEQGKLNCTNKCFNIEHPIDSSKRLAYGCLEGPENGVYVRGKLERGNSEHEYVGRIPDHFGALVEDYSIFIGGITYAVVTKLATSFTIKTHCYIGDGSETDFMVIGARKDSPLEVEQQ